MANKKTIDDNFPLPNTIDLLDKLGKFHFNIFAGTY